MTDNEGVLRNSYGESQRREFALAELAHSQHGVVASWQMYELGFTDDDVQYRLAIGRLHRKYRGVYAVGHRRITRLGRYMAAALAYGPHAVISHRTAAILYGVIRPRGGAIHITVPGMGLAKRRGIVLHEVRALPAGERTAIDGIPVASLPLALLGMAATNDRLLQYAVDEAANQDLLDVAALAGLGRGRKGNRALRAAIALYEPTPRWTRSELEKRALKALRGRGVRDPAINMWVVGYECDMVWLDERVIVEIDGAAVHGTRAARERDPVRDIKLQTAGFAVTRATEHRLKTDAGGWAADVDDLLSSRRPPAP